MPMKDILSSPLPNNCVRIDKNYNKNAIDFILKRNDQQLISLLEIHFRDVIKIFSGELKNKDFDGFKTIDDEIKKIKKKIRENPSLELEEMKYIKNLKYFAKNYEKVLLETDGRTPKKKKIN